MRVCMLTTGFPRYRGDLFGSFVLELARALVARGVQVEVVAPGEAGAPRRDEVHGVRVRRFSYFVPRRWQRVAYGGGIPTNLAASRLARLQVPFFLAGFTAAARAAAARADLVHGHWTISGLVGWLACRPGSRPVVLTVRGSDIHQLGAGQAGALHGWICRRMGAVVAVSQDIAGRLHQAGVPAERVHLVYNGVDSRFAPGDRQQARRELGLPSQACVALFVGLLVPVKGLDVLLESVRRCRAADLLCVVVGGGPLRDELEHEVAADGLQERVRFAGQQPSHRIPTWMHAADLLVLPSRSEGRPNVVLEAQACGLPVVATRVGGTPELVRHGESGMLVDSDDAPALAACLDELAGSPERRAALGQAGRRSLLDAGLTWGASAQRMEEIYARLQGGG